MGYRLEVLDVARREFDEAFVYYAARSSQIGEAFRAAVRSQVLRIQEHPDAWMLIRPGVRKCLGHHFPYDVIYQKIDDRILILALAHKKEKAPLLAGSSEDLTRAGARR
jgi:plasmid stabilization system protein ParE